MTRPRRPFQSCIRVVESMMPLVSSSAACSHPPLCGGASAARTSARVSTRYAKNEQHRRLLAVPEIQAAAASVLVAGIVGVGATLLLRRSSFSQEQQQEEEEASGEECWDCGGTGLCGLCKGEGFVFKQLSEDTATRARKAAKNMATRYTAGLPTKWTYCNKCSSTRSCPTCRGSGKITTTVTSISQ